MSSIFFPGEKNFPCHFITIIWVSKFGLMFICGDIVKIEAVTRRILWIKTTDPEAKVLVFSSWHDVLNVLEHAFTANGITHIRMKGGR